MTIYWWWQAASGRYGRPALSLHDQGLPSQLKAKPEWIFTQPFCCFFPALPDISNILMTGEPFGCNVVRFPNPFADDWETWLGPWGLVCYVSIVRRSPPQTFTTSDIHINSIQVKLQMRIIQLGEFTKTLFLNSFIGLFHIVLIRLQCTMCIL